MIISSDIARLSIAGHYVRRGAPPVFSLLKRMARSGVRGSYRLLSLLNPREVVEYALDKHHTLTVPLFLEDARWDLYDVITYEATLVAELGRRVRQFGEATLIDCGADIGLFSVRLCQQANGAVRRVFAIEPNAGVLPFLSHNLSHLPVPGLLIAAAASNLVGTGRLEAPPNDESAHARYLVSDSQGSIVVTTVDDLKVSGNVMLKIDVEGGELAVLQGAEETIRQAPRALICFEAHSEVAKRIGQDPARLMRWLQAIRPFTFVLTTHDDVRPISPDRDLFDPSSPVTIWNVIADSL